MQEDDKVLQDVAREGDQDGQRTEDAIEKADADFNPDDPDVDGLPEDDAAEVDDGVCTTCAKRCACAGHNGRAHNGLAGVETSRTLSLLVSCRTAHDCNVAVRPVKL